MEFTDIGRGGSTIRQFSENLSVEFYGNPFCIFSARQSGLTLDTLSDNPRSESAPKTPRLARDPCWVSKYREKRPFCLK